MGKNNKRTTFNQITAALARKSEIPGADSPSRGKSPVVFSFKHLDDSNPKFGLARCKDKGAWAELLIERLKGVCTLSLSEFVNSGGNPKADRSHIIDFSTTTEKAGFPILAPIWKERPWQFQLSVSEGRVHGFLIEHVFYVVWFDPEHELWKHR